MSGTLWVCGTPIGNLQDVSARVLETLRQVDLVAAEDTRRTLKLLSHFAIKKPLVSYHEHNARQRIPWLLERLRQGAQVALVTDAGMPGISDPGTELVQAAAREGIDVRVVPGPSAMVAALAVAGLPTEPCWFEGFLPRAPAKRRARLAALRELSATLVFFEAPHRVRESVLAMAEILGGARPAAIARELTKVHEEVLRGTLDELARRLASSEKPIAGEITIVVGPPAA